MAKYKVTFSGLLDKIGNLRRAGEILDESEIANLELQVERGAVVFDSDNKSAPADKVPTVRGKSAGGNASSAAENNS